MLAKKIEPEFVGLELRWNRTIVLDSRVLGLIASILRRLWTDYKRFNETHFWSDIASNWWSQIDESQVNSDGDYFKFKSRGRFSADIFGITFESKMKTVKSAIQWIQKAQKLQNCKDYIWSCLLYMCRKMHKSVNAVNLHAQAFLCIHLS